MGESSNHLGAQCAVRTQARNTNTSMIRGDVSFYLVRNTSHSDRTRSVLMHRIQAMIQNHPNAQSVSADIPKRVGSAFGHRLL